MESDKYMRAIVHINDHNNDKYTVYKMLDDDK